MDGETLAAIFYTALAVSATCKIVLTVRALKRSIRRNHRKP
jgi:hypothetical protein